MNVLLEQISTKKSRKIEQNYLKEWNYSIRCKSLLYIICTFCSFNTLFYVCRWLKYWLSCGWCTKWSLYQCFYTKTPNLHPRYVVNTRLFFCEHSQSTQTYHYVFYFRSPYTAALKKVIISETTLLRFLVSLPHEHLV